MSRSALIARKTRSFRAQKGLSLSGLSRVTNVSRNVLSNMENGDIIEYNPHVETLNKMAIGLQVSLSDFLSY